MNAVTALALHDTAFPGESIMREQGGLTRVAWVSASILLLLLRTSAACQEVVGEDVEARNATTRVFRTRQEVTAIDPDTGRAITTTREGRFIEKGSGLCYRDQSGAWVPADPKWNPGRGVFSVADAAYDLHAGLAAGEGVAFSAQGRTLSLVPRGLVLIDGEKESPFLDLEDGTTGFLHDARRISFPGAYGAHADLDYDVSPSGFHQNVTLRSLPDLPPGLSQETTSILLRTSLDMDAILSSGLQVMVNGELLSFPNNGITDWVATGLISFDTADGPVFWFADSVVLAADGAARIAEKRLRYSPEAQTWLLEERMPLEFFTRPGAMPVTWDYEVRAGVLPGSEVWKAGDTIFISSTLTVANALLTIEPDCCVKINAGQELSISTGKVIAKGLPYRPITFTSADDDQCGELIPAASDKPNRCLVINAGSDPTWQLEFCRFNKTVLSNLTVTADSTTGLQTTSVKNCVFKAEASGNHGLYVTSRGSQTHAVSIENNLFENDPMSGGTPIGIYAGTPSPSASFSYTIRNNTFVKWYYGIYITPSAGYGSMVKQNIFSSISGGPDYVNINSTWLKNGYYQSSPSYRDSSPITVAYYPFDDTTAPTLGLYYLNNVYGGGAYFRWAGADTASSAFGPEYRQFQFQAPTSITDTINVTSKVTISPAYDYSSPNQNVSIGFHSSRVDRLHAHNLLITVPESDVSLEVTPDSVVAHDTVTSSSPYIFANRAHIGGAQSTDKWVT